MERNEAPQLTAQDAAFIGSRLAAILLGGRMLASLPSIPMGLALMRTSTDLARAPEFAYILRSSTATTYMHLVLILCWGQAVC